MADQKIQTGNPTTTNPASPAEAADFMPIKNWDYIEFYVGNARQAAHYYATTFGFTPLAYAGMETGMRDRASYVLEQGKIRLVLTAGLGPESPFAQHVLLHGDGAKDVALEVPDAEAAYNEAIKRGAKSAYEPVTKEDSFGRVKRAGIYTYGETMHSFVERSDYAGPFLPGYREIPSDDEARQPLGGAGGHRPRGRQRRAGQDERLGEVL